MSEYDEIVSRLEAIEASSQKPESIVIDTGKAFSNKIEARAYSYDETRALISRLEGVKKIETAPSSAERVQFAGIQQPRPQMPDITSEIKHIVSTASESFEKDLEKGLEKIETSKLILPSLSLQDQLSELEKISEGLDEQVFDEEQLKIIVAEVKGLRERIKFEKTPPGQFQSSFLVPRNNRLTEVENKLYSMGKLKRKPNA